MARVASRVDRIELGAPSVDGAHVQDDAEEEDAAEDRRDPPAEPLGQEDVGDRSRRRPELLDERRQWADLVVAGVDR